LYKNLPVLQLAINSPFIIIGYLLKFLFFVRLGYSRSFLAGILEGARSLQRVKKVKYQSKHTWNYVKIECRLIVNTFNLVYSKLRRLL